MMKQLPWGWGEWVIKRPLSFPPTPSCLGGHGVGAGQIPRIPSVFSALTFIYVLLFICD